MVKRVLTLLCLAMLLTACGSTRIEEKPVLVETVCPKQEKVPVEYLVIYKKSVIPDGATYGEGLKLWAQDRATIDIQNGNTGAIIGLQ